MKYREIKCNLPKEIVEEFLNFLEELQTEGYYEILFDADQKRLANSPIISKNTNIHIYLGENEIEKEIKIRIFLKLHANENSYAESRIVETRDFEEAYKEFYKPFYIGEKFVIIPTWEKDSKDGQYLLKTIPNSIPLFMNPGLAFGTGHHETTKLMLERIAQIVEPEMNILDLGTGSGILSIACGLLGANNVLAVDIDPNAVKASLHNISENQFSNTKFEVIEGGFDHSKILENSYNLVLANITFAVLSHNLTHLNKISAERFLFSGITSDRSKDFIELLKKNLKGEILYQKELNEWIIIDWKRN
ncbi:MAG: 50S ribosomal protein L11 methyltransferase [Leptospiraceae bacterium]|nr:50S ribosomal protein L11 methyltransferase [Leptospiraceae bacterium]